MALQRCMWLLTLLALLTFAGSAEPLQRFVLELHRREIKASAPVRSLLSGTSHPVHLSNLKDVAYHLQVQVGTPCKGAFFPSQQTFVVIPDTGSADLWVPSASCWKCLFEFEARYDAAKSCSSTELGEKRTFRYGDGTQAVGAGMSDTVALGDLFVEDQFFFQVKSVLETTNMRIGGILGLGHHRVGYVLENSTRHAFIWNMFAKHPQLPRQFSFFLSSIQDAQPSQLVFGEPDVSTHAKEAIRFSRSYSLDMWLATLWSIGFSGSNFLVDFPAQGTAGIGALVDSGTSLIVLRPDIYNKMISELQSLSAGCVDHGSSFTCACPAAAAAGALAFPTLSLTFVDDSGGLFTLCMPHEEWLVETKSMFGGSTCSSVFFKGDLKQPTPVILGQSFMRAFYTTFDVAGQRVGFARSSRSPVAAGSTCAADTSAWWMQKLKKWGSIAGVFLITIIAGCGFGYCSCPGGSGEDEEYLMDSPREMNKWRDDIE